MLTKRIIPRLDVKEDEFGFGKMYIFNKEGIVMMTRMLLLLVLLFFVSGFSSVFASEVKELKAVYPSGRTANAKEYTGTAGSFVNRVLCVDGLKVFQTVAYTYSTRGGVAASSIQLYEERNGKVVPIRCK